jgi:hypothetical protein
MHDAPIILQAKKKRKRIKMHRSAVSFQRLLTVVMASESRRLCAW